MSPWERSGLGPWLRALDDLCLVNGCWYQENEPCMGARGHAEELRGRRPRTSADPDPTAGDQAGGRGAGRIAAEIMIKMPLASAGASCFYRRSLSITAYSGESSYGFDSSTCT